MNERKRVQLEGGGLARINQISDRGSAPATPPAPAPAPPEVWRSGHLARRKNKAAGAAPRPAPRALPPHPARPPPARAPRRGRAAPRHWPRREGVGGAAAGQSFDACRASGCRGECSASADASDVSDVSDAPWRMARA